MPVIANAWPSKHFPPQHLPQEKTVASKGLWRLRKSNSTGWGRNGKGPG